jgi:hypothetical protein
VVVFQAIVYDSLDNIAYSFLPATLGLFFDYGSMTVRTVSK